MWFAFILLSLSYWKQLNRHFLIAIRCCDLLSFYYLCRTGNNLIPYSFLFVSVVICFHFTIFVVLETTSLLPLVGFRGCDLLSFYYLCRTGNNLLRTFLHSQRVVICFHFTIFVVLETTTTVSGISAWKLWFAFILLSLSYWKQQMLTDFINEFSCDLLSFYYLCRTGNNSKSAISRSRLVVICFHFTIFVVLETTITIATEGQIKLWFAFILLSLSYWKQQLQPKTGTTHCCDLLSFYYLCRTGNNPDVIPDNELPVVICFHFTIFVVLETTDRPTFFHNSMLWFAFILLSLSYWKQHWYLSGISALCCDLLSFYYLCRTGNNGGASRSRPRWVVICFHFTIFVVLETTFALHLYCITTLWFAFILLSLSYWKQHLLYICTA